VPPPAESSRADKTQRAGPPPAGEAPAGTVPGVAATEASRSGPQAALAPDVGRGRVTLESEGLEGAATGKIGMTKTPSQAAESSLASERKLQKN